MPDFQGTQSIILQPGDSAVPYTFEFTVCSNSTANDGAIPYGHSVSSVVTAVHREDGTAVTTGIVSTSSETSNVVTLWLSYPTSSGALTGKHHITFTATLADATTTYTHEFDFNRLLVRNR
jgi:hypothetical protein